MNQLLCFENINGEWNFIKVLSVQIKEGIITAIDLIKKNGLIAIGTSNGELIYMATIKII